MPKKVQDEQEKFDKWTIKEYKRKISKIKYEKWFYAMRLEAAIYYCNKYKWIDFDGKNFNIKEHCSEFKKIKDLNLEEMIDSVRAYEKIDYR
ncbi:MAG: hypothetical protein WCJ72_09560 [Chryseobacterium sp.]